MVITAGRFFKMSEEKKTTTPKPPSAFCVEINPITFNMKVHLKTVISKTFLCRKNYVEPFDAL